ncbi:L-lysine-epsilon aminotransferase lat' [Mycobacterium tuberculosis variant bovis BCG]|nr:L-lysine-epsilon aminotransferase lat' [Mycobacterium tuberculosis variant bovis BCG]AMC52467.1 L-lysine-epsilon aminotransferase [Mycobacterium tuberculosis variant bovis BCG]KAF3414489.1 putative l-lysine-epsilon aminotransferase lat' [Mycobacterium tuberculosis variant bovis]
MLVDGLDIVLDLTRSGGSYLVDAITGRRYLDMFTFVASSALGMNPPALVDDREFHAELMPLTWATRTLSWWSVTPRTTISPGTPTKSCHFCWTCSDDAVGVTQSARPGLDTEP